MKFMKHSKIFFFASLLLSACGGLFAQSETSAVRLAGENNSNIGSARFQGMAGSMGAIGVEYSALNTNPAGICLYRSSGMKYSLTFGFDTSFDNTKWEGSSTGDNRYEFKFDEFSWMSSYKTSDIGISYGFGIQRGANFNRAIDGAMYLGDKSSSIADYAAAVINRYKGKDGAISQEDFDATGAWGIYPWFATLAARNIWVASDENKGRLYFSNFRENPVGSGISSARYTDFDLMEKGNSMKYNFAFGLDLTKRLYLGMIMNFYSISYDLISKIAEEHRPDEMLRNEYLTLSNTLSVKGGGADFGIGMIVEPTDGLRLGMAAFSPTYYSLKEHFYASATSKVNESDINKATTPEDGYNVYELSSPWRFTLSAAYIWGKRMAINFDYEASMLNSIRLGSADDDDSYNFDNRAIKEDFNVRNTFRLGAELNVTNRFALRAGAAYSTSGIKNDLVGKDDIPNRELAVSGTQTIYSLEKDSKTVAIGMGYKITPRFSIDFSVSDYITETLTYPFPIISDPAPVWENPDNKEMLLTGYDPIKRNKHLLHGALTLSYKF